METVVILDHDRKNIEGYKRMLEASREQIECKFFESPEEVVDYVKKYPVAVLLSELEAPCTYMSGKEVFEIVEMLSPSTIRIAMTQVEDMAETLEAFNNVWIFKMILKPFFLPEDLINPIREALKHYKKAQEEEKKQKKMEFELEKLGQEVESLNQGLDKKKRKNAGIYHVALGIIKANLNLEISGIDAQTGSYLSETCEKLLQEFVRCYMYESHNFEFHAAYLKKCFHHPENGCTLQIQNKAGQKIPEKEMSKIAYGMFLGGCLCQCLLVSYRLVMLVEREGQAYLLRSFFQYTEEGEIYRISNEKARNLMVKIIKEIASSLSVRMVMGSKNGQFAIKLYFGKDGEDGE